MDEAMVGKASHGNPKVGNGTFMPKKILPTL